MDRKKRKTEFVDKDMENNNEEVIKNRGIKTEFDEDDTDNNVEIIKHFVNYGSEEESVTDDEDDMPVPIIVPRSQRMFFDAVNVTSDPLSSQSVWEQEMVVGQEVVLEDLAEAEGVPRIQRSIMRARDGFDWQEIWDASNPEERREAFHCRTGPVRDFPTPYSAFTAIWCPEFMARIAEETNRYARNLMTRKIADGKVGKFCRLTKWHNVSVDELYVYFALLIEMGITVKATLKEYWSKKGMSATPYIGKYMSCNRFMLINACLHFVDNSEDRSHMTQQQAQLHKVSPVIRHLNTKFQNLYSMNRNIVIDNSLTQWKGYLKFKQSVKSNQAARVKINSYEVCDSKTGYLWRFKMLAGRDDEEEEMQDTGLGYAGNIMVKLLEGLENKGYTVWMDSYYSSPAIARFLKSRGFDCVGTLRFNRQGLPSELRSRTNLNMAEGQINACTSGDVDIVVWRNTNCVAMISTYHGVDVHKDSLRNMPTVVHDYNRVMCCVDKKDSLLSAYPLERTRSTVWYKKIFRRLLNCSILNSFVLHRDSGRDHIHVNRQFRKTLVSELTERHFRRASVSLDDAPPARLVDTRPQVSREALEHFPKQYGFVPTPGRRERVRRSCVVCHKRQFFYCGKCNIPLCPECSIQYHT